MIKPVDWNKQKKVQKKMARVVTQVVLGIALLVTPAWSMTRNGEITMEFKPKRSSHVKEIRLWIPYPVSTPFQRITDIKITGNHSQHAVYSDRMHGNMILFAKWDQTIKAPCLTFQFKASRDEIVRKDFPEKEAPWSKSDYANYLYRMSPLDSQVRELADEITSGKTTILSKAKAIYDWVVKNMYRDPNVKGCGDGDVYRLLKHRGGKCIDINSVFVALAKAADVPSREVFGIRLGKGEKNDISKWQHCWAEFYLPGYGWVPVDPADVLKTILVQDIKLEHPKTEEYRNYYFGTVDPYRIKLSTGKEVELNPVSKAGTINYFMYPYMEIDGQPADSLSSETFQYRFTFKEM
ncbi:MAG: transglutaminase domain-containing protein [Thermodesulfobacteriota bacterium]|nr:transglutaminase domain-containing protein [Thermodesulfobacteriota bacterium]